MIGDACASVWLLADDVEVIVGWYETFVYEGARPNILRALEESIVGFWVNRNQS